MNVDMHKRALDDCFLHDHDRLPHGEAINILRQSLPALAGSETIALDKAAGRILDQSIVAPRNIPFSNNSAVDGYAFNWQAWAKGDGTLELAARIAAGDPGKHAISGNMAARIFTGALMPEGADSVAMQEDCTLEGGRVFIPRGLKSGANVRNAGEDVSAGETILAAGQRLTSRDIAAIAATGLDRIRVNKLLRVTLFSSGNELLRPGEAFRAGSVYDSNHLMLSSLAANLPLALRDGGILPDRREVVEEKLLKAAQDCDVIVTSGGASLGEEDHMVATLDRHGRRAMWQLAIKPGRPMIFGHLGQAAWFGLPGNPVAGFICFLLYVRPALLQLAGGHWCEPRRYLLPANFEIANKKPDRREFYRAILITDETGRTVLDKFPRDGSGLISGLRQANGLAEIAENVTSIARGDLLSFIPFSEFGLA